MFFPLVFKAILQLANEIWSQGEAVKKDFIPDVQSSGPDEVTATMTLFPFKLISTQLGG